MIPGSGRSPGGGRGNPLWYSFLENPMDRGAWQAMVQKTLGRERVRHNIRISFVVYLVFQASLSSPCITHTWVRVSAKSPLPAKKNLLIMGSFIEGNVVSSQFFYNHPSYLLISRISFWSLVYINKVEFVSLPPCTTEVGVRVGLLHCCLTNCSILRYYLLT